MAGRQKRREQTVVVDLGRGAIRMALAEAAGEAARFRGITACSPPAGSELAELDDDQVVKLIAAEVQQRGWGGLPASCLLSKSATSTQSFQFPPMPEDELRQAIRLKLAETLHFDVEQACFDFRVIKELDSGGTRKLLVLVVAAEEGAVYRAVRILRAAGLRPRAVGAASESLANLTQHTALCQPGEATIHADIGADSTILNLFEGRLLRFSRELACGGDDFTRALMRPILTELGAVQLTFEQAEEVKAAWGYPLEDGEGRPDPAHGSGAEPEEGEAAPHGVHPSEALQVMEPVAQRLVSEFRRSVDYLSALLGRGEIDRIVLSGPASDLQHLDTVLERSLGTKVVHLDPVARAVDHWRLSICDEKAPSTAGFSAILGHSIGSHKPINLLPREARLEGVVERVSAVRRVLVPTVAGTAACLALMALPIQRTFESADRLLGGNYRELERQLAATSAMVAELDSARSVIEATLRERGDAPRWVPVMQEIADIFPPEVQLVSLSIEADQGRFRVLLEAHVHQGPVPSEIVLLQLTRALTDSPFFDGLHVRSATMARPESTGDFEATLELLVPEPGPDSDSEEAP